MSLYDVIRFFIIVFFSVLWTMRLAMPFFRNRFPVLFNFAARLAILAVLVPVATNLVHHPAAPFEFLHICGIDQSQQGSNHGKRPEHQIPSCPICNSLHIISGGFFPPMSIITAADPVATVIYHVSDKKCFLAWAAVSKAWPRAPPGFV